MVLGTLGANLWGYLLRDRGIIRADERATTTSQRRGKIRAREVL